MFVPCRTAAACATSLHSAVVVACDRICEKRWLSGVSSACRSIVRCCLQLGSKHKFDFTGGMIGFLQVWIKNCDFRPWPGVRGGFVRVRCERLFCDWRARMQVRDRPVLREQSAAAHLFQPNASTARARQSSSRYVVPGAAQAFLVTTQENKSDSTV